LRLATSKWLILAVVALAVAVSLIAVANRGAAPRADAAVNFAMAVDANEDGGAKNTDSVEASVNVIVGATQKVGFDITTLTGLTTGYQAYQLRVSYDNTKLTPSLPAGWPGTCGTDPGCNQWTAPAGIYMATGPTDNGSNILVSVTANGTGSNEVNEIAYFSFLCKAAGAATVHIMPGSPTNTHIVDDDGSTTFVPTVTDATINCQEATPTPTLTPVPPTATPTLTPTPPAGVRMEKDANVLKTGVDTVNNLWLHMGGCVDADEGKGCLRVEKWVFEAWDVDSPNDSDTVPEGVGAWEEQKKFDHKIIALTPVPDNTWLESDGRIAICNYTILTENWILEGCVTKDDPLLTGMQLGPNGNGKIEDIIVVPVYDDLILRMRPTKDNGVVTDLIDENCEVADIYGEPLPGTLPGGLTTVCGDVAITVRMLEGDVNLDCIVDSIDDQRVAYRYGASFGLLLYDPWYDLEPKWSDFDVDIKDLQFVFGRNYSTCQAPIPNQFPVGPPPSP